MLIRFLVIVIVAIPSWYFTDMESTSRFLAYVLPLISFACYIAICFWVIAVFAQLGQQENDN